MGVSSSSNTSSKTTTTTTTSASERTFSGVGNLIKLLPTGTVFLFQFLNPILTNSGSCKTLNKTLDAALLVFCGLSCCFASFTDSYTSAADGATHYGIATASGLWPASSSSSDDLSAYKLRLGDFVHAFFSLFVFAALSLLDSNTVQCFYPELESGQKLLLQALPPIVGVISGTIFVIFPNTRHGIGYPSTTSTSTATTTTA